jgi:hypothetical protein
MDMQNRLMELRDIAPSVELWQIHYVLTRTVSGRNLDPTGELADWLQATYQIDEPEEPPVPIRAPRLAPAPIAEGDQEGPQTESPAIECESESDWFIQDPQPKQPEDPEMDDIAGITSNLADIFL